MRHDTDAAIRSCYLFADAAPGSIAALAGASRVIGYDAGARIFDAGDEADGLRVVLSGGVRIALSDAEGRELTLAFLEAGDPFGEIALLDGLPRTAGARAVEATTCLYTSKAAFEAILSEDPALSRHIIHLLCESLRRNLSSVRTFAFVGLGGRLAQKLHDLALDHAKVQEGAARFERQFSQSDLAQMLGVTREAVNKRMKALMHDGLVRRDGNRIVIPDLAALAERAQAETALPVALS